MTGIEFFHLSQNVSMFANAGDRVPFGDFKDDGNYGNEFYGATPAYAF